jgi:hypothetical protein
MEGSGSSGFDMSKMSTAQKLLAGGSILLLIFSFFPWQTVDLGGIEDVLGVDNSASMWGGSGSFAGVIAGLLAIALVIVGVLSMTGAMASMNMGSMTPANLVGWLGAGVFVFGILKFIFALTGFGSPGWAAFVGLVLLLAIGYGAWQQLQSSGGFRMGDPGDGTMGGGMPPPSGPPPSAPPSGGGMPPSGTSDM